MGLFDRFFNGKAKEKALLATAPAVPKVRVLKEEPKSEKEIANSAGEPYVAILRMDIDPNNLHQGSFELDWNEIFVSRLVKAGYMIKPTDQDVDIVDRWFQTVCRHVVMETWEQEQAIIKGAGLYVNTRDIGDGRTEVS
jgi:hypothetical protein